MHNIRTIVLKIALVFCDFYIVIRSAAAPNYII